MLPWSDRLTGPSAHAVSARPPSRLHQAPSLGRAIPESVSPQPLVRAGRDDSIAAHRVRFRHTSASSMTRVALMLYSVRQAGRRRFESTAARSPHSATRVSTVRLPPQPRDRSAPCSRARARRRRAAMARWRTSIPVSRSSPRGAILGWRRLIVSWVSPSELDESRSPPRGAAPPSLALRELRVPQPRCRGRAVLPRAPASGASSEIFYSRLRWAW